MGSAAEFFLPLSFVRAVLPVLFPRLRVRLQFLKDWRLNLIDTYRAPAIKPKGYFLV